MTRFSETSKIVQLFTRRFGRVSALAKGACRNASPFSGALEVCNQCEFVISMRPTRDIQTLCSCAIIDYFRNMRNSDLLLSASGIGIELIRKTVHEGEPLPRLYGLLTAYLKRLDAGQGRDKGYIDKVVWMFMLYFLKIMGFAPVFTVCVSCGSMALEPMAALSPLLGGVLCEGCGRGQGDAHWIPAALLDCLARLSQSPIEALEGLDIPEPDTVTQILKDFFVAHFEKNIPLHSLAYYSRF